MSRIGRMPITVPAGTTVTVEGSTVTAKGANGSLTRSFNQNLKIELEGNVITVSRPNDENESRALHGLTRTLINNMIIGVTTGYKKELEINGVGYRASMEGKTLVLNIGYSHPIKYTPAVGIKIEVGGAQNKLTISGADKEVVGQTAAEIRSFRLPEPYLGKGIKYVDEVIRRKEGKAGKGGKK